MRKIKITLFVILLSLFAVSAYAGIIYNGNEYTETMMPYSQSGTTEYRIVVSGNISFYNDSRMTTFEINGVDMLSTSTLPTAEDGKKYFIHFKGKNRNASISFSGTNDWTEPIDTTSISIPYTENGAGEYYFSTTDDLSKVNSSNMDELLINDVDYTNQTSTLMPARINGSYFIYYKATSALAEANFDLIDTTNISLPFSQTGEGRYYYSTSDDLYAVNSSNIDTLLINNIDYANQSSTSMPAPINGKYYIYYFAFSSNATLSLTLEPGTPVDTIDINVPYTKTGVGQFYFVTSDNLYSINSSNMDTIMINDVDYTNQTSSTMPPRLEGSYYIYYSSSSATSEMSLEPEPFDTVTITSLPFSNNGIAELYFGTTLDIGSITSTNMDGVEINGVDYTNQTSTEMPVKVNGYYYIYYKSSNETSSMLLEEIEEDPLSETINWNGNDYTKTMMPYSNSGSTENWIVISGSISSYNDSKMKTFEINGVDMLSSSTLPSPEDGKKYFIHFKGRNNNPSISFDGTNDWSEPVDTTAISIPYTESGACEYYFSTTDDLSKVNSSNMDELLINDIDYTNQTSTLMPARINGSYFIYYKATSALAEANFDLIDTTEISLPFSKTGKGRYYFSSVDDLYAVTSSNLDELLINNIDYTNQNSTNMPAKINGQYYIYYLATSASAEMSLTLEPGTAIDTINVNVPFSKAGVGQYYFTTTDDLYSVSSSNMDTIKINDSDYTNQNSSAMPSRVDGKYYIYYASSSANAEMSLELEPLDTVTITSLPFLKNGISELYFATSLDIGSISSVNMDIVEINGVDFTNQTSVTMPVKINGYYYIYYKSSNEIGSMVIEEVEVEPYPDMVSWNGNDYSRVDMPYSISGGSAQYIYVYGSISSFSSSRVTNLTINGSDYTNQSSTTPPASIDGKYFIYYNPKNRNSSFQINGTSGEITYVLNIKVFLQSAFSQ